MIGLNEPIPPPKIALCAGLKSSGSTWLYNVVIQILEVNPSTAKTSGSARRRSVILPFYADELESFPERAERAGYLVIKTHIPASSLQFVARFARAKVFVTVREPRDAIVSLLQRFGHSFEGSLREISTGAARMVELARTLNPLILRYEDRFFDAKSTVVEIGAFLGHKLSQATIETIHRRLCRNSVTLQIDRLCKKGVFGAKPNPDCFDPKTHWHPGHVGDGLVGKFGRALSESQQRAVLAATADYCRMFGYPDKLVSRVRRPQANKLRKRKPG